MAKSIYVDGSGEDWVGSLPVANDTAAISHGEFVWHDAVGDERTDLGDGSNYDLTEFRIATNDTAISFMLRFRDITDANLVYVAIAIDTIVNSSGQIWLPDNSDTQVAPTARWDYCVVANTFHTGFYNSTWVWFPLGISYIDATNDVVEIAVPRPLEPEWNTSFRYTVVVCKHDGSGGVVDIGGPSTSDVLDTITTTGPNTWNEVIDGAVDYNLDVYMPIPDIRISEVCYKGSPDWAEIYCLDDGNGGNGINVSGMMFTDLDGTDNIFNTSDGITMKPYDDSSTPWDDRFLVVSWYDPGDIGANETDGKGDLNGNGVRDIYTLDTSLTGTDDQLVLVSPNGYYMDAVCWANNDGTWSEKSDVDKVYNTGQWQLVNPAIGPQETDCFNSTWVGSGDVIARLCPNIDVDNMYDWFAFPSAEATPGHPNPTVAEVPFGLDIYLPAMYEDATIIMDGNLTIYNETYMDNITLVMNSTLGSILTLQTYNTSFALMDSIVTAHADEYYLWTSYNTSLAIDSSVIEYCGSDNEGILVERGNKTAIKNTTFQNGGSVRINGSTTSNNTIENCRFENLTHPLIIENGTSSTIANSTFMNNSKGVVLINCQNCVFENNTVRGTNSTALEITATTAQGATNNTIAYNKFVSNIGYGVYIHAEGGNVAGNRLWNNSFIQNNNGGIQASDATGANEWNVTGWGNFWSDYVNRYPWANITSHIWDVPYDLEGGSGARDYYPLAYQYHEPIRIDGNAEFAYVVWEEGWAGTGTAWDPYIIEWLDINGTGYGYAFYIGNTTYHFVIQNSHLHHAGGIGIEPYFPDAGIVLCNVSNGIIAQNNISANNQYGLYINGSRQNNITNNTCLGNTYAGVWLFASDNNTLKYNVLNASTFGLVLNQSANNTIVDNNISATQSPDSYAVTIINSSGNIFDKNNISDSWVGLWALNSSKNTFTNNTITNSSANDILVSSGNFTVINCTFNVSKVNVSVGANLFVQYYHAIFVYDNATMHGAGGVANAHVWVNESGSGGHVYDGVTNAEGYLYWVPLTAYRYNDTGIHYDMQNMSIHASKAGYLNGTNLTNTSALNYLITIYMEDPYPPEVYDLSITPSQNINVNHTSHIQAKIMEDNLNVTAMYFALKTWENDTAANYTTYLTYYDQWSSDMVLTEGMGNVTYFNMTWNATAQGGYLYNTSNPDERIYVHMFLDLTFWNGTDWVELRGFWARYRNASHPAYMNASVLVYASNFTLFGIHNDDTDEFYSPDNIDPTSVIGIVRTVYTVDKSTSALISTNDVLLAEFAVYDTDFTYSPRLPSGEYLSLLFAGDRGDNWGETWTTVSVDYTGPENISLYITPLYGNITKGNITFTAITTSSDARDATFQWSDDGVVWHVFAVDSDPNGGWSTVYDSTQDPDRNGYVRVVFNDTWGNTNASEPIFIEIDNTPPSLEITAPSPMDMVGGSVWVEAHTYAYDAQWCRFEYRSEENIHWTIINNDTDGSDGWRAVWNTSNLSDGLYYIRAVMADAAGNVNTTITSIVVDNTPPNITNITPQPNQYFIDDFVLEVGVNESNMAYVEFWASNDTVNWYLVDNDTDGSDGWSTNVTFSADGPTQGHWYVRIKAYDMAGNNATAEWDFYADLYDPYAEFVYPQSGSWLSRTVDIEINASDNFSGIDHIEVYYNDTVDEILIYSGTYKTHISWATTNLEDGMLYKLILWAFDVAGRSNKTEVDVGVDNTPPTAWAGHDIVAEKGEGVSFDGTNSSDTLTPLNMLNFTWTIETGEGQINLYGPKPSFTFDNAGYFPVILTVRDLAGNTANDSLSVTVTDPSSGDNTPPVARAGGDIQVPAGTKVMLDGSNSTDDVGIVSYVWEWDYQGEEITLYGEVTYFTFDVAGLYPVKLTVADAAGNIDSDTVNVSVIDQTITDTIPPVADAGPDQSVNKGEWVVFNGSASTDNVGIASYVWLFQYDNRTVVLTGPQTMFKFDIAGIYVVTLTVMDFSGNKDTDTMTVFVGGGGADTEPPVAVAGDDIYAPVHTTVVFDGSGSHDNIGIVAYTWYFTYNDTPYTLSGMIQRFTFHVEGDYNVTLTVMDGAGNTGSDSMIVHVYGDLYAPIADAGANITTHVGEAVVFDATASVDPDVNGSIANYTWTFMYNGTTVTLYGPTPEFVFSVPGEYVVTLTVTDLSGKTATDIIVVTVLPNTFDVSLGPLVYENGDVVVNAHVRIVGEDYLRERVTSTTGYIYMDNVTAGMYHVTISVGGKNYTYNVTVYENRSWDWDFQPIPVPVEAPKEITVTIGPVKDKEGNILPGVNVTVVFGGKEYTAVTDADGMATVTLPPEAAGANITVRLEAEGYKAKNFNLTLDERGRPAGPIPALEKITVEGEREKERQDYTWIVLVIIVLALIAIGFFLMRRRAAEEEAEEVEHEGVEGEEEGIEEGMEGEEGEETGEEGVEIGEGEEEYEGEMEGGEEYEVEGEDGVGGGEEFGEGSMGEEDIEGGEIVAGGMGEGAMEGGEGEDGGRGGKSENNGGGGKSEEYDLGEEELIFEEDEDLSDLGGGEMGEEEISKDEGLDSEVEDVGDHDQWED